MKATNEDYYSIADIVNFLKSFFRYVQRRWWFLLLAICIGAASGLVYFKFFQQPKYEATCTFILEEKQSGLGGLSGLASQFGLDMGGMTGGGNIFAGDNVLEILKSRKIIQNVLLSKVDSINENTKDKKLADLFLEFSGWKSAWSSNEQLKNISFAGYKAGSPLTIQQDSVLGLIYEHLVRHSLSTERLNKKGSIIKVTFTAASQPFAKLMSDRVIDESKAFYIAVKTSTALENVIRLERKSDSLLALLNNKSYEAAGAVVLDANPALRTLGVPSELKMRDKAVLGTIYSEVIKNLEISRISLSQETPVMQILDRPTFPLADKRKSAALLIVVIALVCFLVAISLLIIRFAFLPGNKR